MMKNKQRWLLLCAAVLLGAGTAQAQRMPVAGTGCSDTVPLGVTQWVGDTGYCWLLPEGSNWQIYGSQWWMVSDSSNTRDNRIATPWLMLPESAAGDSLMLLFNISTNCNTDYSVCVTTDGVTMDTLYRGLVYSSGWGHGTIRKELPLWEYAGQTIRIEFCHYGLNSTYTGDEPYCSGSLGEQLHIENIVIRSMLPPLATVETPGMAYAGEPTRFVARLTEGSGTGLVYRWISRLTGTEMTGDTVAFTYSAAGTDTVMLVATNAYGADTVEFEVMVYDCFTRTTFPWTVDFEEDYPCWRGIDDRGWDKYYVNGVAAMVSGNASAGSNIMVSPAIALPTGIADLRLHWTQMRRNTAATKLYVMVSTAADPYDITAYDTVYTTSSLTTSLVHQSILLDAYAGQTIHIAFSAKYNSSNYNYGRSAIVGSVGVWSDHHLQATLQANRSYLAAHDTSTVRPLITQGQDSLLAYQWTSTMVQAGLATVVRSDSLFRATYSVGGVDTVTLTLTNALGSIVLHTQLNVYDCDTISSFPWGEDFEGIGTEYDACWNIDGWHHPPIGYGYGFYGEEKGYRVFYSLMCTGIDNATMTTPLIRVPATGADNLALWVRSTGVGDISLRISAENGAPLPSDTTAAEANYTIQYPGSGSNDHIATYTFPLASFAGQTVRATFTHTGTRTEYIDYVGVDVDTLPRILATGPSKTITDSATQFEATLLRGAHEGLAYTWLSSMAEAGLAVLSPTGSSMTATYLAGGTDTVRVVATNAYGSDTATVILQVTDCTPVTHYPWRDNFDDGITCWTLPSGSGWRQYIYYLSSTPYSADEWIISKALVMPADATDSLTMVWRVWAQNVVGNIFPYQVMVSTDTDYTDLSSYTPLYIDTLPISSSGSTWSLRSVSLAPYAGHTIHIAFRTPPDNSSYGSVLIDNLEVRSFLPPHIAVTAPQAVNSGEAVSFTASLTEGSSTGLTYTWHSSLMDTTITADTLVLTYPAGGTDTVLVVATNAYGADSALAIVQVADCRPHSLPFLEDFSTYTGTLAKVAGSVPSCWTSRWDGSNPAYAPHVVLPSAVPNLPSNGPRTLALMAGTDTGYDTVSYVELPLIDAPYSGLYIGLRYCYERADRGLLEVGYFLGDTFVSLAPVAPTNSWRDEAFSLAAVPASAERIAFRYNYSGVSWYSAFLEHVSIYAADTLPSIAIDQAQTAMVGDTSVFTAHLVGGLPDSLQWSWHSSAPLSFRDESEVGPTSVYRAVHSSQGYDTVTVVARNAYGSDSARVVVQVNSYPLPAVSASGPATAFVSDTVQFSATVNATSPNGFSSSWSSAMAARGLATMLPAGSALTVVYHAGGIDTVVFSASNAYGAAADTVFINVKDCDAMPLPYDDDFSDVVPPTFSYPRLGMMPDCWTAVWSASADYSPTVYAAGAYPMYATGQALVMTAGRTSGRDTVQYVMLPRFADSLNNLVLVLSYSYYLSYSGRLSVGYMVDGEFHGLADMAPTESFVTDTVSFMGVAVSRARMALRWACTTPMYNFVGIDRVQVYAGEGMYGPSNLWTDSVGSHCVWASWWPVSGADAYEVTAENLLSGDRVVATVTDTTATLCGLDDGAPYRLEVAPVADSVVGRPSFLQFQTQVYCSRLVAASAEVHDEGVAVSWQYDSASLASPTGAKITITDTLDGSVRQYVASGTDTVIADLLPGHRYSVAVQAMCDTALSAADTLEVVMLPPSVCAEVVGTASDNGYSHYFLDDYHYYGYIQSIYPASFAAGVDTLYGISLHVTGTCNLRRRMAIYMGHTTLDSLASPITATALTQVAQECTLSLQDTGWARLYFDQPFAYDGVSNLIVTLDDYTGNTGGYYCNTAIGIHTPVVGNSIVASSWETYNRLDPNTLGFDYMHLNRAPDIQLLGGCGANYCMQPVVQIGEADSSSVAISWNQRGSETLWQVEYRVASTDSWLVADTTSATRYTLAGLNPSTRYQVRVGSICGSDTLWSLTGLATTACTRAYLPYTEEFSHGANPCWQMGSYYLSEGNDLNLSQWNSSIVVSPELAVADMQAVEVRIRARRSYYEGSFAVGVCEADGSGLVWVDTVRFATDGSYEESTVYLNRYSGTARHIALRGLEGYSAVNRIVIDTVAGCLPVHHLWVTHLTHTGADLHWRPNGTANQWAVSLDDSLVAVVTSPAYSFTGLAPASTHTASVSEICGPGDTSAARSLDFRTACIPTALPYAEDFSGTAEGDLPPCWSFLPGSRYATAGAASAFGNWQLRLYDSPWAPIAQVADTLSNFACTPLVDVGTTPVTVSFRSTVTANENLIVGVMTDIADTNSFIPVLTVSRSNTGYQTFTFSPDSLGLPATWAVAFRWRGHAWAFVDDIEITPRTVDLTVGANDTTMGTVSGGGTYVEGTVATLRALPHSGYRFVQWNDADTHAVREVRATANAHYIAYFDTLPAAPVRYLVSAVSTDTAMGTVSGGGLYDEGETATLVAMPREGHRFVQWNDADTHAVRTLVVTSDTLFSATFEPLPTEGIDEAEGQPRISLYPNPTGSVAMLRVDGLEGEAWATVVDMQGRTVGRLPLLGGQAAIDASALPRGTYFVRIEAAGFAAVRKLVVQ